MLKIDLSEFIYSLSMALYLVPVGLGVDEGGVVLYPEERVYVAAER